LIHEHEVEHVGGVDRLKQQQGNNVTTAEQAPKAMARRNTADIAPEVH